MRREGFIPSVVYGGGSENRNVKVSAKGVREMLADTASTNVLVDLELDGGSNQLAFLKDLQHDPLSGKVLHADFIAVDDKTEITAQIPVSLVGEAVGVKLGGQLEQMIYSLEIKCLPKDLPETIEGDASALNVGDVLSVGGMSWPEGVSPTLGHEVVVALVAKTRVALSEAATGEEDGGSEADAASEATGAEESNG
tara:strand:- start:270 stop:857 length:588 start_codon:yes stop_codon:yes gene_type:complete